MERIEYSDRFVKAVVIFMALIALYIAMRIMTGFLCGSVGFEYASLGVDGPMCREWNGPTVHLFEAWRSAYVR